MDAALPAILLCAAGALPVLAVAGHWLGRTKPRRREPLAAAAAMVCAAALAVLLLSAITRPVGLLLLAPGIGIALDAVNLVPLVILFAAALATYAHGRAGGAGPVEKSPLLLGPLAAGWALALLAADALTLTLGLLAGHLTVWVIAGRRDDAAALLATLLAGLAALLLALDLQSGSGHGPSFAAMRALPPGGWRAALVLFATLGSVLIQALRLPLLRLPPAATALIAAAVPALIVYLAMRLLLDLAGPAQPLAWGVPVLLAGIGCGLAGGARALQAADVSALLAAATLGQVGLSLLGLGVVAMARAADQPDLAAFALAGTLVQLLAHAAFKTLLVLGAASVRHAAGTETLAALGGVARGMPITTACLLAGAAALASLPVSAGFLGVWMLLQSLYAAARLGGTAVQWLVLAAALAVGLVAAFLAFAALRLVGVGLLGRPRIPRTAGAIEPPRPARAILVTLAGVTVALGAWPAPLFGLAAPAVRALTLTPLGFSDTWLAITPPLDTAGLQPLGLAALLAALVAIAWLLGRSAPAARAAPRWAGGDAPPPPWLPFGDPALQIDAAGFSNAIATVGIDAGRGWIGAADRFAPRLRPALRHGAARWQPVLRRYRLALGLAALILLLLALAVFEAA